MARKPAAKTAAKPARRTASRRTAPKPKFDRALTAAIRKVSKMQSSFIYDTFRMVGYGGVTHGVHPVQPGASFCGPAVTLRWAPARKVGTAPLSIYEFIRTCDPGTVLIMETGEADGWFMGENMAHHAMYQGLAAMVTDSNIRDYADIAKVKMPVFSRGPAIRNAGLELVGNNVPIVCGGAQVEPGDLVMGDPDGIAVIPQKHIADVVYQAEGLAKHEAAQEKAIRDGVPMPELKAIMARKKVLRK